MPCKNCDHEVGIGELVEFHAETFPDEDTSIRESILRKMEAGQDFDAAEDVFLNETLAAYAETLDAPDGDADTVLARELALYAMNDASIHRQRIEPFAMNYGIKKAKGTFNKDRAIEGLANNLAKDVQNKYSKELGGGKAPEMNKATKMAFGAELLEDMTEMIDDIAADIKAGRRDKRGQDILMKSPDNEEENAMPEKKKETEEPTEDEEEDLAAPTEEDTVPEEQLDMELPPEDEEEVEAEVEEAEAHIDGDIENYEAPGVKDYLKTFAVFAVAASGAIVGIFLTLKGIAALSKVQ